MRSEAWNILPSVFVVSYGLVNGLTNVMLSPIFAYEKYYTRNF